MAYWKLWKKKTKKTYFTNMEIRKSVKHKRYSKAGNKKRWWCIWQPFACVFARAKKVFDDSAASSPDKTSLMSFEELSAYGDPCLVRSHSSDDSDMAVFSPPNPIHEQFPYWESDQKQDAYERDTCMDQPSSTLKIIGPSSAKKRSKLLNRSITRIFSSPRKAAATTTTTSTRKEATRADEESHFSTSTEIQPQPYQHQRRVNIHITEGCRSPSDSSTRTEKSRMSLEQFMEEKKKAVAQRHVNLADVSANDSASLTSSFLNVSYDEDFPQLVLQQSMDGTVSRMDDTMTTGTLGATFSHPASQSVASFDTTKQRDISCTPNWLKENMDKVCQPAHAMDGHETGTDDGATFDDDFSASSTTYTAINEKENEDDLDWKDHLWSFSADKSFEQEIFPPVGPKKPICRTVEGTDIPTTHSVCGARILRKISNRNTDVQNQ